MSDRMNVYVDPDWNGRELAGWFDRDKAEEFPETTRWDGSNHISRATGSQWDHEMLFRTAGGRWVLKWWSQRDGAAEQVRFVDVDAVRHWLLTNEYDTQAVAEAIGEDVADGDGPMMGRPEIGRKVEVRLPDEILKAVEDEADRQGVRRAELLRSIITAAVQPAT